MFAFALLFPDNSIKSTKLHFQGWKKFSLTILLFFCTMTAEVSRNNCAKRQRGSDGVGGGGSDTSKVPQFSNFLSAQGSSF